VEFNGDNTMKQLLIATAALSLIGGAAFAQTTTAAPGDAASPPATYPICTSKHEDSCVNRSQATRMASNGMHMRMHHMKHMSSSTMTTDAAPAPTPSQ
jgi:hypothetical protein